jgi:hypothetical protein
LAKQLRPVSEFHKRRNIDDLKRLTKEVSELIGSLSSQGAELNVDFHFRMAMKGIVQIKAPVKPRSAAKPVLNTSDLDGHTF